jgi:two-component system OmpR family response regulator
MTSHRSRDLADSELAISSGTVTVSVPDRRDRGDLQRLLLFIGPDGGSTLAACSALWSDGFGVLAIDSAAPVAVLYAAAEARPDLVVAELGSRKPEVQRVLQVIRNVIPQVPVLLLFPRETPPGERHTHTSADGHLLIPFSLEQLRARADSMLNSAAADPGAGELRVADLVLDSTSYEVTRAGEPVELSRREFDLLRYLMRHEQIVLSRDQILNHVWDYGYTGTREVVDVYISTLRKKIDHREPKLIHTIRGVGYMLRQPRH